MEERAATKAGNILKRRAWRIAVGLSAVALAFGIWHRWTDSARVPTTDPAELEQQARERPDDLRVQLQWGETLVHAKRLEAAIPVLTHAQRLAPNDARPYAWLGIVAISEHRVNEARGLLGEAL